MAWTSGRIRLICGFVTLASAAALANESYTDTPAHPPVFLIFLAQAGSTGGTIGKQGKSAGSDATEEKNGEPAQRGQRKPPLRSINAATASAAPQYLGCFRDQGEWFVATTKGRDLNGLVANDPGMTTERCISICRSRGFDYAGTQYRTYCFCGHTYGRSGPAHNCNMACGGNPAQMCGGSWANSVYRVSKIK